MEKQKIVIISLSVALFLVLQYVILDNWVESNEQKVNRGYQLGYEQGLIDAVVTIYQQTENCKSTVITIGNLSKKVFDMACSPVNSEITPP